MRIAWLALLALLLPLSAAADELRPGLIEWTETAPGEWQVGWTLPVVSLPSAPPAIVAPDACRPATPLPPPRLAGTRLVQSATYRCVAPLAGTRLGLAPLPPGEVILRVAPLSEPPQVRVLTAMRPVATIAAPDAALPVWRGYLGLGFEHILEGWDHLLFVTALVLIAGGWRRATLAVTAFTVAHSVTLAASVLGAVSLNPRFVEAAIALSIVLLAVELVRGGESLTRRYPAAVAFAFGLLHGFGFAGALAAIGLPEGDVAPALLAFNLGVEAGQLALVATLLAMLALARRAAPTALAPATRLATYAIGITGAFWLIDRTLS